MKQHQQLPAYLSRASNFTVNTSSVEDFSKSVLAWWKENGSNAISAWVKAARIVFSIAPNSASCERVFSLVKSMFGDQQMRSLADYIQAALQLRYNKRSIG